MHDKTYVVDMDIIGNEIEIVTREESSIGFTYQRYTLHKYNLNTPAKVETVVNLIENKTLHERFSSEEIEETQEYHYITADIKTTLSSFI